MMRVAKVGYPDATIASLGQLRNSAFHRENLEVYEVPPMRDHGVDIKMSI